MKSLVVYSSQSGNTRKLAEAVYQSLPPGASLSSVDEAPDPGDYDFVALGFWLQAGQPDPKSQAYLKKLNGHARVFLFATHGANPDSEHARSAMTAAQAMADGATFAGSFDCYGEVNPKVLEKVRARPDAPAWIADADKAVGHPDSADIEHLKAALGQLLA
ncbi:Flavodoxin family protein [Desulfosarcina cetonica]|uniref:flavodoxin family protein n=1 Tax=Desulfosarcina cetonica TaxID=90730 RepID=UPI0006D20533|nr:flavodoxin family protein [Desulfosarcina cetonica]VTR69181.1 Flavodoxin family protein [Desulfosarcina cetonica]